MRTQSGALIFSTQGKKEEEQGKITIHPVHNDKFPVIRHYENKTFERFCFPNAFFSVASGANTSHIQNYKAIKAARDFLNERMKYLEQQHPDIK